jgi:hypothetical protein
VNATGWMPAAILDGLTLGDVADLNDYWQSHPPVQAMVQAYLGIKPKEAATDNHDSLFQDLGY